MVIGWNISPFGMLGCFALPGNWLKGYHGIARGMGRIISAGLLAVLGK
jgi:hypothetical protein